MAKLLSRELIEKTRQDVHLYFGLAKDHCKDWHNNIEKWRQWYDFKHYKEKPLPFEERYPDPTPTNVVDLAVGILVKKPVEFKAKGWDTSLDEEADTSRIEKYLNGTLYVNGEREELNIPYEIVTHLVRDGGAVVYSVWDKVIQDAVTEQGEEGLILMETPIRVQVIDPMQMYILPGGPKRWHHVFRVWEMTIWDVEHTWNVRLKRHQHLRVEEKMTSKVKVYDYWRVMQRKRRKNPAGKEVVENYIENALVADDLVIRPLKEMKGYDDIPYTITFFKPVSRDRSDGWHGILRPIESTVVHLEKAINRRGRQIRIYTSLPFVARTIPQRRIRLDPALGKMVHLNPEESLEFPTWPGNSPDVEHHIGFLRSRLQQAGFTDVMFGEGPSQISGYALNQLGDQNQIRLEQPIQHLAMLWSNWARKVLKLTAYFTQGKLQIRVYGELKGQDFAQQLATDGLDGFMVKAKISPVYPNDDTRKHAMGTQTAGTLSLYTRLGKYYDIEQPDEERDRLFDDMVLAHPMMVQNIVMQKMLAMAKSDDPDIAAAAQMVLSQQMSQGGPAGPQGGGSGAGMPGAPAGPVSPIQPTGLQSSTGEATPTAEGKPPAGQGIEDILKRMTEAAPGLGGTMGG